MIRTLQARHVPPSIPPPAVSTLAIIFAVLTTVRGLGWALGNPELGLSYVVATALVSPVAWGILFAAVGVFVIVSYFSRLHLLVWVAHALAAATYAFLAITIAQAAFHFDAGFQHLAAPLGGVAWHAFLAWLTGPVPRQTGGTHDTGN